MHVPPGTGIMTFNPLSPNVFTPVFAMRRVSPRLLLPLGALLLTYLSLHVAAVAQIPERISYQGFIAESSGEPVPNGPISMTFAIYTVQSGGTPIWSETHPAVAVNGGYFSAELGSVTPLNLPFDVPYWLGTSMKGDAEMTPRTSFAASPYGLRSKFSDSAASVVRNAITTANLRDGAVTLDKLTAGGSSAGQVLTSNGTGVEWKTVSTQGVGGVSSLNGATGAVDIAGGAGVVITRNGGRILLEVTGGGSGITTVTSADPALTVANPGGPIVTLGIAPGGITESHLAVDAVSTTRIKSGAVTSDKIADGNVATVDLADGAVTTPKIADGAVNSAKILDGTVATVDLADGAVTSAKILDGTIATVDLADGAVTSAKILDGTVATVDLADGAVTSAKIFDGTIATVDIAANAVDAAKISTGGASSGLALISNGVTTPVWGNPTAGDLVLPFVKSATAAGVLLGITNTGAGGVASFTVNSASNSSDAMSATTNGTGYAGRFTGTGSSSAAIYASGPAGGKSIEVNQGRVVLSYATVASGGTIGTGASVVEILSNNVSLSAASATLPTYTNVENGTVIIVATADPDGAVVTGTGGATYDIATGESRTFIRISNGWKGDY